MTSLAILKNGCAYAWRVKLVGDAMDAMGIGDGIYQQAGAGQMTCVIHACKNLGEPFDSARHRAAYAMWNAVEQMTAPKNKMERAISIKKLRTAWDEAQ